MRRATVVFFFCCSASMLAGCFSSGCDSTPGTLAGACNVPSAGQCIDYSGLGDTDQTNEAMTCVNNGGIWQSGPCATANRIGTCNVPSSTDNAGINCSSAAMLLLRYFAPYTATTAQDGCGGVSGATYTPG